MVPVLVFRVTSSQPQSFCLNVQVPFHLAKLRWSGAMVSGRVTLSFLDEFRVGANL